MDFIQANRQCHRADLFEIALPNGQVLRATDGPFDITAPVGLQTVTVPGTAMPWRFGTGFNTAYEWGSGAVSHFQDGTDPVLVPCAGASSLTVSAAGSTGSVLSIGGTGHAGPGGLPRSTDPNIVLYPPLPSDFAPGSSTSDPNYLGLVGAFCDGSGNVLSVVKIGASATLSVPSGATVLQLGVNDIKFSDNSGAFTVTVFGGSASQTFYASTWGNWSRGAITSEASTKLAANTMDLTCIPDPTTQYPGLGLGLLSAALNHLFDGATVWVFTAYMPLGGYGDVSAGIETKWQGTITSTPEIGRNRVRFQCADPLYLLNMKIPSRLFQANCPWGFTDSNCTLTAADYTVPFTAGGGSTQRILSPSSAFSQSDGYFTQGVVKCITGANAGLSHTVKVHASGNIEVMAPWLLPVTAGDTFSVIKGCDKTLSTCKATKKATGAVIDNSINFGGTPFVPVPSSAI
jgi:uncharacterized phage protein (TIGR02218 family)